MKKKMIVMVCCLAIAFVGVWFGFSCFEQENLESDLTMANVEALSEGDAVYDEAIERQKCHDSNGTWNMASICVDGKMESIKCTVEGQITIGSFTIKGSYTKGHTYNVGWARYSCQVAKGECCNKQGIYSGGIKLD